MEHVLENQRLESTCTWAFVLRLSSWVLVVNLARWWLLLSRNTKALRLALFPHIVFRSRSRHSSTQTQSWTPGPAPLVPKEAKFVAECRNVLRGSVEERGGGRKGQEPTHLAENFLLKTSFWLKSHDHMVSVARSGLSLDSKTENTSLQGPHRRHSSQYRLRITVNFEPTARSTAGPFLRTSSVHLSC